MLVLIDVLKRYASGKHSFRSLAQGLNSKGFRTTDGRPFTESSISTIFHNRFYNGEVVYHRGQPTEEVFPGVHEVPEEIKELKLVAVKPCPDYAPLFAYSIWRENQEVGGDRSSWVEQTPPASILASGIGVLSIRTWLDRISRMA